MSGQQVNFSHLEEGDHWIVFDPATGKKDSFYVDRVDDDNTMVLSTDNNINAIPAKELYIRQYHLLNDKETEEKNKWY